MRYRFTKLFWNLFSDDKAWRAGDLLQVKVVQKTTGKKKAKQSISWFEKACGMEWPAACVDLGHLYKNGGDDVPKDPDKAKAFSEIFRVLKPRGRVQIADIVVSNPISDECRANPNLWAECVVGASLEDKYIELFRNAGFQDIQVTRRFDPGA